MRQSLLYGSLLILFAVFPTGVDAQASRAQIIEQARDEFVADDRIARLGAAVNLEIGPPDSLWAVAVHELAQTYFEEGDSAASEAWLRWAAWVDGSWEADEGLLLPSVVAGYRAAQGEVADRPPPRGIVSTTRWGWPSAMTMGGPALLEVTGPEGAALTVTANGVSMQLGRGVRFGVGTYEVEVSGEGFVDMMVTLEVLPGVTTVVELRPYRSLSTEAVALAHASIVEVTAPVASGLVCSTGFYITDDGWVVTSSAAVQGDGPFQVRRLDGLGEYSDVRVAVRDSTSGLALLEVGSAATSLEAGLEIVSQGDVWSLGLGDCGSPIVMHPARLLRPTPSNVSRLSLRTPIPASAIGGPLVDLNGGLLGVLLNEDTALSGNEVMQLVVQARRALMAETAPQATDTPVGQLVIADGGGGKKRWLLLGTAALAGGIFALSSGGDSGGPPPVTSPSQGTITIKWGN